MWKTWAKLTASVTNTFVPEWGGHKRIRTSSVKVIAHRAAFVLADPASILRVKKAFEHVDMAKDQDEL